MFGVKTSISEIIYYTNLASILTEVWSQRFNFQVNFGSILFEIWPSFLFF